MFTRFSNWMNGLYERAQAVRAGDQALLTESENASSALPALPDVLSHEVRARVESYWQAATAAQADGEWAGAEHNIRQVLELEDTDEAWHFLAVVLAFSERLDESQAIFEDLLQRQPGSPEARHDLANVCRLNGDISRAEALYTQAIQLAGAYPDASRSLGQMLLEQGQNAAAAEAFDAVVGLGNATSADHCALGVALLRTRELTGAREAFSAALALDPDDVQAHSGLGEVLRERGLLEQAISHFSKAAELRPDTVGMLNELGATLIMARRFAEAVDVLSLAVSIKPHLTHTRLNLGTATLAMGNAVDAVEQLRLVLEDSPEDADIMNNLGNAERDLGNIPAAVEHFRNAIAARPDSSKLYSNLLLTLLYDQSAGTDALLAAHKKFAEQYGATAAPFDFNNSKDATRRVRVAYMSPDLRRHPVGQYMSGVLAAHDRERFEIICYADVTRPDVITELCKDQSDLWVSTVGLDDDALVKRIREDEIDMLIDLSGHTAQNRLRVLAARAAPIQLTWIGYVGTTGLTTVDYILADKVSVPDAARQQFTETVLNIDDGYLCYACPAELPPLNPPPCLDNPHITFGCFSTLAKLSDATLKMWGRLLAEVPDSVLFLQRGIYADERVREVFSERATRCGLNIDQVTFSGGLPYEVFLKSYSGVDIMLDTVPFSGGSTTAEALWMGVPVVTLAGDRFGSRTSASLLAGAGLDELIATTPEEYVAIASSLAREPERLSQWRTQIRAQMANSNSGNPARLTAQLDETLSQAWHRWCTEA